MVSFYPHRMMEWLKLIMLHIFDLFRLHDLIYVEPSVPKTLGINGDLLTKSEATHELRETCNFKYGSATCCLAGVGCRNGKRRVVTGYKFQNNFPTIARKYIPFPSRVANSRPNARNTPIDVTPMFADFWPSCPVQNNNPLDAAGAFHMPKPRAHADASCD